MPDRIPTPAPFAVGTRVRYLGTHRVFADAEMKIPLIQHGMEFTIKSVHAGRRGTLVPLRDEDGPMFWEDTGEPMLDETKDGYSVYEERVGHGRIIWPKDAHEWEVVRQGCIYCGTVNCNSPECVARYNATAARMGIEGRVVRP